jgi:hypothetical protein
VNNVYIEPLEEYAARMPDFARAMETEDRELVYGCLLTVAAKTPTTKRLFELASMFGPRWLPMNAALQAQQDRKHLQRMLAEPSTDPKIEELRQQILKERGNGS